MMPLRLTRAGIAGTLLALAAAAVCARLGVWQLDRLAQRREQNAVIAERLARAPLTLQDLPPDTAGLLYRVVTLEGDYDVARSIVLRGRALHGAPGVHVLTPLRLPGGAAVLVNRGWVPSPDAATVELATIPPPRPGALRGLALPYPAQGDAVTEDAGFRRTWTQLDLAALRRQYPYALADFYVQALPPDSGDAASVPRPLAPPELDDGPHLGYAVQWFAFATIALVGWTTLVLRRGSQPTHRPIRDADR
ncbi:MAG TPA: SURF1 family protein [Longimicrobiales bacterium]